MAKRPATGKLGIDISARMFHAALVCIAKEETRSYLNGVHVEPHPEKGAILVATDGCRMIVLHDPDGYAGRKAIIAADKAMLVALRQSAKVDGRVLVDRNGIAIIHAASFRSAKSALIDGTFPPWAVVVRPALDAHRAKRIAWAVFNPDLIGGFGEAAKRLGLHEPFGRSAVRVCSTGEGDPALVLFERATRAFGMVMPIRTRIDAGVPTFMKPILSALPRKPKTKPAAAPKPVAKSKPRSKANG